MKFSYNWLQSYFKKKLPAPEKLADFLTAHAFEVEGAGKTGQDWVLDIVVTPNRAADAFSHLGLARECAAILNYKTQSFPCLRLFSDLSRRGKSRGRRFGDFIKVEVENSDDCFRYTASVMTNVKITQSPAWIQERLRVCGLRPINNVVDVTNYVMLETGQPLHAFDFDKIAGSAPKKIIVRRAKKGEKIVTLEEGDKSYKLDKEVLLIADKTNGLAIAGIKGGQKAEIGPKTKTIVLESANFSPYLIRRASRQLKISTDASSRFEHGLDPNLTDFAILRATALIKKISGGEIVAGLADVYPKKINQSQKVKLDLGHSRRLLGAKISDKQIKSIIKGLSLEVVGGSGSQIIVKIPSYRRDLLLPEDLVEEIGRIYGYEKIPAELPKGTLAPPRVNEDQLYERRVEDILAGLGLTQSLNYSFIGRCDIEILQNISKNGFSAGLVQLLNPLSEDKAYLRPSLLLNLIKNAGDNFKHFKQFGFFEIGKVFKKKKPKIKNEKDELETEKIQEKNMLSLVMSRVGAGEEQFFELKGMTDVLFSQFGVTGVWYDDYQPSPEDSASVFWRSGYCAEIKIDQQEFGFLGELNPQILNKFGISERVFAFEIDWEKFKKIMSEERFYQPPSKFPAIVRDLAVLVSIGDKVEQVLNVIERVGGPLLIDVDLFDFYEGGKVEDGKKSLAFHLIFQSKERSLSDKEVNEIQKKIIKELEKKGWRVRK